jgi:hypothetical protein
MNRSDSQLVLHDVPILLWLLGLIFAGVGAFIVFDSGRAPAPALALFAFGLGALLFTSVLTITADRVTRILKLDYRSALRHTIKQVSFDEIVGINVERSMSRNQSTYQVTVTRKDGQVISLRSFSSSGSGSKERQASQLREFIGVVTQPQQVADIHETDGVRWTIQPIAMGGSRGKRWHSPDVKTPGVFLFVAQKAEGQATGGFLASLGSMFFKQAISMYGFHADDTPGLDQAAALAPLDPAIEPHFMAFTNDPASARHTLNPRTVMPLADWAGRYPLKQFQIGSRSSQLAVLFGPNGVCLCTLDPLRPDQENALTAMGVELVKSQSGRPEHLSSPS